jgi:hypothetical protein
VVRTHKAWDARTVERRLRARLAEFHGLLAGNVDEARGVLRQLLPERLRFTPRQEGGYQITGHVACDGLFTALVDDGPHIVVPPG